MTPYELPAMANAHSHAFQRDLRGAAERRIRRVFVADPGMGVVRHADAGYPEAIAFARERGVRMPMLDPEPA